MRELSVREMGSIYGGEGGGNTGGSSGGSPGGDGRGGGSNNGSSGGNGGSTSQYVGINAAGNPMLKNLATGVTTPAKWSAVFQGMTASQNEAIAAHDPVFSNAWNNLGRPSSENPGGGRGTGGGR